MLSPNIYVYINIITYKRKENKINCWSIIEVLKIVTMDQAKLMT